MRPVGGGAGDLALSARRQKSPFRWRCGPAVQVGRSPLRDGLADTISLHLRDRAVHDRVEYPGHGARSPPICTRKTPPAIAEVGERSFATLEQLSKRARWSC
jgi:hypothetical protein